MPATIELTEVETRLRQLLLDVAAYCDQTTVLDSSDTEVKVPDELATEPVVLRWTGGWVRDKLLGVTSHDIDVAINKMTGIQFGLKMKEYLEVPGNAEKHGLAAPEKNSKKSTNGKARSVAPGLYKIEANPEKSKHLETVTTKIMDLDIDLVNLRKETYTEDSRNPQMEFGTPEEDAMRRDATVNAMFYNLNTSQIEDFTGRGFSDMELQIIRTPLEPFQTFKDDPLRVLRLIRFASRLDYKIDPAAEHAMGNPEIKEALRLKISRERVGIETEKMLKGPDPHMALALIDRLGLYETIFTDPTRTIDYRPALSSFPIAYDFIRDLRSTLNPSIQSDISPVIGQTLILSSEEQYLAWLCAAVMPWADAPLVPAPKPTQKPLYYATLVAREGIKAPNKVSDVVTAALRNQEEIRDLVGRCYGQLRRQKAVPASEDPTARDTLGMAIRNWGPTWRSQVLYCLLYELVSGHMSRETILSAYTTFLNHLTALQILEAHNLKPLIDGKALATALNTKPGPWMKTALDSVIAWQLRNPNITDPALALQAVQESNSELSSALARTFLSLTIRPLFSQASSKNAPASNVTAAGYKANEREGGRPSLRNNEEPPPWKEEGNASAVGLLKWVLSILDDKGMEKNWGLLIPPILKMMDDMDIQWKAQGCSLLTVLLQHTPPALLKRTGLGKVFEDELFPFFTYLPSLTEEKDSATLLDAALPALMALTDTLHPPNAPISIGPGTTQTPPSSPREKFLDKILREGILSPLFHAQPSSYPRLASTLLSHLPSILTTMQVDCIKHLQTLLPVLASILAEPLGAAYPPLLLSAVKGLQAVILNAWPRVGVHRGEILKGLTVCWVRLAQQGGGEEVGDVKKELKECIGMLDRVMKVDREGKGSWESEKKALVDADSRLQSLFEEI